MSSISFILSLAACGQHRMDDTIYFSLNRKTCAWIFDLKNCRIQTSNPQIAEKIGSWSFATETGREITGLLRIFSIPRRKWRWSLKKLGIKPPSKNRNRQIVGLRTSRQNFKKGSHGSGRKNLKGLRGTILRKA